jgi:CheY-like chemotaxis protein
MSPSPPPSILNLAYRKHVMLLYHTDEERNAAAVDYINEGLKSDHLCIYASVGAYDSASKWHYSNLSSKIENFEENVTQHNLVIIDFKPCFETARKDDPTDFNQLKAQLQAMLKQRITEGKSDKIFVFADGGCTLSENKEFEKCIELESWWDTAHQEWTKSSQNITVICPQPAAVFNEEEEATAAHAKTQIAAVHNLMLEASRHPHQKQHPTATTDGLAAVATRSIRRVLIAEPEKDIQIIYQLCLDRPGLEITIVPNAAKCFELVFNTKDSRGFDFIILDTHLKDISGVVAARQIKQRLPDQRIIITTTTAPADEIERVIGISKDNILQKPFYFSKLLDLIKAENPSSY